jgi:hypothetical protein
VAIFQHIWFLICLSGYVQTDDRTDVVSYFIVQTIFCWKNRFYDYEKALGQSKGLAIRSAKYGFTSDLISDNNSSNGDLMSSMHGLFSGVGSLTMNRGFLMRRGGASIPSSSGDTEGSEAGGGDHFVRSSHGLLGAHELSDVVTRSSRPGGTGSKGIAASPSAVPPPPPPPPAPTAGEAGTGNVEEEASPALGSTCSSASLSDSTKPAPVTASGVISSQIKQLPVVPFGKKIVIQYATE